MSTLFHSNRQEYKTEALSTDPDSQSNMSSQSNNEKLGKTSPSTPKKPNQTSSQIDPPTGNTSTPSPPRTDLQNGFALPNPGVLLKRLDSTEYFEGCANPAEAFGADLSNIVASFALRSNDDINLEDLATPTANTSSSNLKSFANVVPSPRRHSSIHGNLGEHSDTVNAIGRDQFKYPAIPADFVRNRVSSRSYGSGRGFLGASPSALFLDPIDEITAGHGSQLNSGTLDGRNENSNFSKGDQRRFSVNNKRRVTLDGSRNGSIHSNLEVRVPPFPQHTGVKPTHSRTFSDGNGLGLDFGVMNLSAAHLNGSFLNSSENPGDLDGEFQELGIGDLDRELQRRASRRHSSPPRRPSSDFIHPALVASPPGSGDVRENVNPDSRGSYGAGSPPMHGSELGFTKEQMAPGYGDMGIQGPPPGWIQRSPYVNPGFDLPQHQMAGQMDPMMQPAGMNGYNDVNGFNYPMNHMNHGNMPPQGFNSGFNQPKRHGKGFHQNNARSRRNGGGAGGMGSEVSDVLREFRSTGRRPEMSELEGHVVEFCKDSHGSRLVQFKMETTSGSERELLLKEMHGSVVDLAAHPFGNYVVQNFLQHASADQAGELAEELFGHLQKLSTHAHGCRVVQFALASLDTRMRNRMINEIIDSIEAIAKNNHGTHVVQKCMEILREPPLTAHVTELLRKVEQRVSHGLIDLSVHPHSYRLVQLALGDCDATSSPILKQLLVQVEENYLTLALDQHGNFVLQHLLDFAPPSVSGAVHQFVTDNLLKLSQHKFGSHLVEKCITTAVPSQLASMLDELLSPSGNNKNLLQQQATKSKRQSKNGGKMDLLSDDDYKNAMLLLSRDPYANFVVQKAFKLASTPYKRRMADAIKGKNELLSRFAYGRHILSHLSKYEG